MRLEFLLPAATVKAVADLTVDVAATHVQDSLKNVRLQAGRSKAQHCGCANDAAAVESVAMIDSLSGHRPKIIDASTAHRTAPGWVYGFAELVAGQGDAVRHAQRVANPGCYATGAIALIRPLIDAGLISADAPLALPAVRGYSGGGRRMIEAYERGVRYESLRAFRHPDPGGPRFLAVYDIKDEAAARTHLQRRANPQPGGGTLSAGPLVWQRHDTLWRLTYRRVE